MNVSEIIEVSNVMWKHERLVVNDSTLLSEVSCSFLAARIRLSPSRVFLSGYLNTIHFTNSDDNGEFYLFYHEIFV